MEQHFDDVEVALASGHVLHLRGSVDRIDQRSDGSIEILDYKTGDDAAYKGCRAEAPHDGGKRLQLYIYGRAARAAFPTHRRYGPVTGSPRRTSTSVTP